MLKNYIIILLHHNNFNHFSNMNNNQAMKYCFLSFDENNINWTGKMWIVDKKETDVLVASFIAEDKVGIIEQAKEWAFKNNYNVEW